MEFVEPCKRYDVARRDLSGSASRSDFDPATSDLDFVVSFSSRTPSQLFDRYFGLKEDLERLFGREVELLMADAMKYPRLIKNVSESRVPLCAT